MSVSRTYNDADFKQALTVLQQGGIILYPSDTIWGIGCDATDQTAVAKILDLKKRINNKGLIVLIDQISVLYQYLNKIPEIAYDLWELSDKPLTLICPEAKNLADNIITNDGYAAFRLTKEAFSKALCSRLRKPIVSTSANYSGNTAPQIFSQIDKELINKVDYVVKYRQDDNKRSLPSGIIKVGLYNEVKIIRQ